MPGTDPPLKWLNPPGDLLIKVVVTIEETDWAPGDRGPVLVGPAPFSIRWYERSPIVMERARKGKQTRCPSDLGGKPIKGRPFSSLSSTALDGVLLVN